MVNFDGGFSRMHWFVCLIMIESVLLGITSNLRAADATLQCPAAWTYYEPGGTCIFVEPVSTLDWPTAKLNCETHPSGVAASLIKIDNQAEQDFLAGLLDANTDYWIGLNDIAIEGTYTWTDGTSPNYVNWGGGEPNNAGSGENCVHIQQWASHGYIWNDNGCNSLFRPICEISASDYLPPIIEEQESGNVYLDSRQETTLKCVASGRPDPTYRWEWNGSPLVPDGKYQTMAGGNLVFMGTVDGQEITNIYDGIYQCFAANDYGVAMGNKVKVNVAYLDKFDTKGRTEVEVDIRNTAVLECNPPEGMPSPDIFWSYPQPSSDSLPYDARINQDPDGRLIFANVEADDARDYICNAQSQQIGIARFSAPIGLAVNTDSTQFGIRAPVLVFKPSPSVTVLRTETLRLKCLANAFPTPEIRWERVVGELAEGRYRFDSYGQELVIYDVSFADEGMYRCTATNAGSSSNPYEVDVNVEAAPYWGIEPTNEIVAPDSNVVFECISNGVPPVEMSWYVDAVPLAEAPANPRREVSQDKKKITFTGLQEVDSAVYVCQVSNTNGEILSSALLHVQVIPAKVVEGLPAESTVARGTDATLTCLVIGSPEPTVMWTFENVYIYPSNRIELGQSPNSGGTLHTLVIKDVTDNDQGSYKCFVENRDADDQSQGNLKVKDLIRIVTPPKDLDVIEGASIKLECGVEHYSSLKLVVDWYKRDEEGQDVLLELTDSTRIYAPDRRPPQGGADHQRRRHRRLLGLHLCGQDRRGPGNRQYDAHRLQRSRTTAQPLPQQPGGSQH